MKGLDWRRRIILIGQIGPCFSECQLEVFRSKRAHAFGGYAGDQREAFIEGFCYNRANSNYAAVRNPRSGSHSNLRTRVAVVADLHAPPFSTIVGPDGRIPSAKRRQPPDAYSIGEVDSMLGRHH